jgi:hypothetical protein
LQVGFGEVNQTTLRKSGKSLQTKKKHDTLSSIQTIAFNQDTRARYLQSLTREKEFAAKSVVARALLQTHRHFQLRCHRQRSE